MFHDAQTPNYSKKMHSSRSSREYSMEKLSTQTHRKASRSSLKQEINENNIKEKKERGVYMCIDSPDECKGEICVEYFKRSSKT